MSNLPLKALTQKTGTIGNHPDIHYIMDHDYRTEMVTLYLWKKVNEEQIGIAVKVTTDFIRDGNPAVVKILVEEAVQRLLDKEEEMKYGTILEDWNPSSRRLPRRIYKC